MAQVTIVADNVKVCLEMTTDEALAIHNLLGTMSDTDVLSRVSAQAAHDVDVVWHNLDYALEGVSI